MKITRHEQLDDNILQLEISNIKLDDNLYYDCILKVEVFKSKLNNILSISIKNDLPVNQEDLSEDLIQYITEEINLFLSSL